MKKLVALLLALVLTFSCSAALAELTFTTGGTSGTYYAFGGVLAQYITDHSDVAVTAVAGEGSAANIDMLDMGFAQLGFVQSDVAYYAYNGIRAAIRERCAGLREIPATPLAVEMGNARVFNSVMMGGLAQL